MEQASQSLLTQTRQWISPYLPPPVLSLIQSIDTNPQITKYVNHEPSMSILVALVSLYILSHIIKFLSFRGKAIEGLDYEPEGNVLSNLNDEQYQDSVILFGPCGSGKSLLFHQLAVVTVTDNDKEKSIQTVMSLKANVKVIDGVRIVDYPGHITLSNKLPSLLLPDGKGSIRAVFVVDSTKPLSEAGALCFKSILTNPSFVNAWSKAKEEIKIMVVCNKSDETGSKNWRRIKIQLRTELDKLQKIANSVGKGDGALSGDEDGEESFALSGKAIDLDDLSKNGVDMVTLNFMSLSCVSGDGMDELKAFVNKGDVLADNSTILKSRR